MARLHEYNDLRSEHPDFHGRRPSIYATFTLARLVHSFINRMKSNSHSRQCPNKPSLDVFALRSVLSKSDDYSVDRIDVSTPTTISKYLGLQQHVVDSIDRHCITRKSLASKSSTLQ